MKTLATLTFFILLFSCNNNSIKTDNGEPGKDSISTINVEGQVYDSVLANKYGADKYGMKKYIFAYLKRGANRNQDSATISEIQKGHMANINRLAKEGKLILAGPFMDDTDVRGIFIFNVETIAEAEALIKTDPAVKSGRLEMELHPWYGSAALMEVNNIHNKISKENP